MNHTNDGQLMDICINLTWVSEPSSGTSDAQSLLCSTTNIEFAGRLSCVDRFGGRNMKSLKLLPFKSIDIVMVLPLFRLHK
mmetsp:Transcript_7644/g.14192  ORF Transcript_7644/g.14192 Transcript_7644/m.14192 type:complete len:81 (-) Transcript_7644:132-374(-)